MSGLDLLEHYGGNEGTTPPGYAPTGFLDQSTAFQDIRQNLNTDAEIRLLGGPINTRNALISERFGQSVSDLTGTIKKYPNPTPEGRALQLKEDNDLIDPMIERGRKEDPARWEGIKTTAELRQEAAEVARKARLENERVAARNPSMVSRLSGQFVFGAAGAMTDPLNLATLPVGAGPVKAVGTGGFATARAIASTAMKEGLLQASIQSLAIPQAMRWQETVGHKYGLAEAATDVGFAFAGGAIVRGGIEGVIPALRGTYRGAQGASSYVVDRVAQNAPRAAQSVKDGLRYMSRVAYVDEAAPVPVAKPKELAEHRAAVEKVGNDINSYKRPSAELPGVTKVVTPRNELELEVKARLVELEDLITSDKPDFDKTLQPRDRAGRLASDVRINEIAARLDPEQLGDSRVSNTGSPIIGPDMMVESGNGRVMALRKVYESHPDRAAAYRDFLESQGYKTKGMKQPVLIRQRLSELTGDQRKQFVIFSNEDVADRLSVTERALADAKLIPARVLQAYEGGDVANAKNQKFVRGFLDQAVSSSDRNAMLTPTGELSQEGIKRINAALLARAYGDPAIVQKIMEDPDNDIKTIGRVLMDLAGQWSKMRADIADGYTPPIYDITIDLMDAVRTIIHARQTSKPISDFTGQTSLFAEVTMSAETRAILAGFYDQKMVRPLGYDKTKDFLDYYLDQVSKMQAGPGLFNDAPSSPFDVLNTYLKRANKGMDAPKVEVEAKAETLAPIDEVPKVGDVFGERIIFRMSIDHDPDVRGKNAGNPHGVSYYMTTYDDIDAPAFYGDPPSALHIYRVKSKQVLSEYRGSTKGERIKDDTIGIREDGSFSFGEKADIEVEELFSVPLTEVRKKLKEIAGNKSFDFVGSKAGGKVLEKIYQDLVAQKARQELLESFGLLEKAQAATSDKHNGLGYIEALTEFEKRPQTIDSIDIKSPERVKLHEETLQKLLKQPEGGFGRDRIIEIILGPPGSGKSSVVASSLMKKLRALELDSDLVKAELPEFDNGLGANAVHEESKIIADKIMENAIKTGVNIVHPLVGATPAKIAALVDKMRKAGYTINVRLVSTSTEESLARNITRYSQTGRLLPPEYVASIGDGPRKTFEALKAREDVNIYTHFDNQVPEGQRPRVADSNDPAYPIDGNAIGGEAGSGLQGTSGVRAFGQNHPLATEQVNALFDDNAYRSVEYRDPVPVPPKEIQPTEYLAARQAQFDALVKEDPDMMITAEDGATITLKEYAARIKEDQKIIEAITTCRVA